MNRRSHKKSRRGCTNCKRRHLKCDETRPQCVNCKTAKSSCSFIHDSIHGRSPSTPVPSQSSTEISPGPAAIVPTEVPTELGLPTASLSEDLNRPSSMPRSSQEYQHDQSLNLEQIELVHHFVTEVAETLIENSNQQVLWRTTAVRVGLGNPFLMYGILAISALHLSCCDTDPKRSSYYQNRATELQCLALNGYKVAVSTLSAENCIPVVLFAGLITVHTIVDSAGLARQNLNTYLEHMLRYVRLSQGNKAIVKHWWNFLNNSECRALVDIGLRNEHEVGALPTEWNMLSTLTTGSAPDADIYAEALKQLQRVYNSSCYEPNGDDHIRFSTLFSWLVLVPHDYYRLLEQRRPEALVLLAYYAVLLHGQRRHWAIGGRGHFLVHAIHEHLGTYWGSWMAWPLEMVRQDQLGGGA